MKIHNFAIAKIKKNEEYRYIKIYGKHIFLSDIEENDIEALTKMAKEHCSKTATEDYPKIDIVYVDYLQPNDASF